ncbi:putative Ankyrin repeat protein [Quillaja saponaria]|uniref:Ankyrin repeat protein n=1 Tax=Quillaja saponaria TaxID=32244 RepID=A0AAD7KUV9_QUISA|nr:putative Ankyrin repeat protein [Quillaja saponaria]
MDSEAPSWADQWGAGGIGAIEEDDKTKTLKDSGGKKKVDAKAGFIKAKTVALISALKIKSGTSNGIKWIKNQCQKKSASK